MDKTILLQYSDALARVKLLREELEKKQRKLDRLRDSGYVVADTVSYGKHGKRSLGTATIVGYPFPEAQKASREYEKQYNNLMEEEQKLLELITSVEEYIAGIGNIEVQNIMTLYYVNNLKWVQVAHRMNDLYQGKKHYYTDSSCRQKHDYFLKNY